MRVKNTMRRVDGGVWEEIQAGGLKVRILIIMDEEVTVAPSGERLNTQLG